MPAIVMCPHCRANLRINPELAGHTLQCPKCRGALTVPQFEPIAEPVEAEDESLPFPVLLACLAGGHFLLFIAIALFAGSAAAYFLTISAVILELAVWKGREFIEVFRRVRDSETTRLLVEKAALRIHRPQAKSMLAEDAEVLKAEVGPAAVAVIDELDDELVELRPAKRAASRPSVVSASLELFRGRQRAPRQNQSGGQRLKANLHEDGICFYGPGTELDLGRGILKWPLVYATGFAQYGSFDASLIDCTLPVSSPGTRTSMGLPYWPNYYDCLPAQRAQYLDWLLSGKEDPQIELGYVFIYFYGLERRVLVDRADYLPIAQEIIRLLPIYDTSNSFRSYASSLLWLTLLLMSESEIVPEPLVEEAIDVTSRWSDDLLGMCLAVLHNLKQPLPAQIAFSVGQNDARSSSSVIVRRHRSEFERLFVAKYHEHFGTGIQLRASKRKKRIFYRPASATLLPQFGSIDELALPLMPDVLAISSQFKQIVQSWDESIESLKAYSRETRKSGGELTAEAFEALPEALREGDHPEEDAWMQVWENHVDAEGWPIIPVAELASIKSLERRNRLTKAQCSRLLATADAIGIGVEPDARMTGKNYLWDERVTLFLLEDRNTGDSTDYVAASILLRLGANIAESDGEIDEDELRFIVNHLRGQFNLSDADSTRLECLQYLLLHSQAGDSSVNTTLAKRLPHKHRLLVGEFLIGVAAIDDVITDGELKALRKAFRSLDLEESELDALIAANTVPQSREANPSFQTTEIRLDVDAISRIMTETREVAKILHDAMAEDDEKEVFSADIGSDGTSFESTSAMTAVVAAPPLQDVGSELSERFRPFLKEVLVQSEWTESEIRELADNCRVMLSGAVEAINEWSMERFGDLLIEEGEVYYVQQNLVVELN